MKKILPFAMAATAMIAPVMGQATSDPVGYTTISVPTESTTFFGVPMLNSVEYTDTVEAVGASSLDFNNDTLDPSTITAGQYLVEVAGAGEAVVSTTITAATATGLTLEDDLTGLISVGDTVRIRKYVTIGQLFGADNTGGQGGAGLTGAVNNAAAADQILVPNGSGGFNIYFFNTNANALFNGWRQSTALTVDAADTILPPSFGFVINRGAGASTLNYVNSGDVQTQAATLAFTAGTTFNASTYPIDATIADIFGAANEAGLQGAVNNAAAADQILVPNGSGFDIYFFNTNANALFNGWRQSTALTVDASNTVISSGQTVYVVNAASDVAVEEDPTFTLNP